VLWDSHDPNDPYQGPGDINLIVADEDAGPVTITVEGHDGHRWGAANVKCVKLHVSGYTGNIAGLHIGGDLADPNDPNSGPVADAVSGTLSVGGSIVQDMEILWLDGTISCNTMKNLTIGAPPPEASRGATIMVRDSYPSPYRMEIYAGAQEIQIGQELSGEISVAQWLCHLLAGTVSGAVHVGGHLDDAVITGDVRGEITTGQELRHATIANNVTGLIDVGTDLGQSYGGTALDIGGELSGTVHVRNDLLKHVFIGLGLASGGLLQVDHDAAGGAMIAMDTDLDGTVAVYGALGSEVLMWGSLNGLLHLHACSGGYVSAYGDLRGTVESDNDVPLVGVFGAMPAGARVSAGQDLRGEFHVYGDLGGTIDVGRDIWARFRVDGAIQDSAVVTVGQDFTGSLEVGNGAAGAFTVGRDWTGSINVTGTVNGRLQAGNDLLGEVTLGAMGSQAVVDVGRNLANHFYVADSIDGSMTVGGDVQSTIENGLGSLTADLWIKGNLISSGAVLITPAFPSTCTPGTIRLDGDMSGTIDIPVLCDQAGDLSQGHIIVNGSFAEGGIIHLSAPLSGTAFFSCDFDGWDASDDWSPNAVVIIDRPWGPEYYYGNTEDQHLWHTTWVRGDLDNNSDPNAVFPDFTDINPFILALSDPASYALTYPGLAEVDPNDPSTYTGGSVIYHGDCNCDMVFDFADINAFISLLNGQPDPNCPDYPEGDGGAGEQRTPEELAKLLADNVAPELYDGLVYVVGQAIEAQPDDESRAYWEAVYAALTE
jgi:hypothetical protein